METFNVIPTLQELREYFKQRLDQIIYKKLTVENIDTFAPEALEELILLNEDILFQYNANPNFELDIHEPLSSIQEQEDDAYKKLELPNISNILEKINEVKEKIESLKYYISIHTQSVDKVITPPDEGEIKKGSGEGLKKPELIPRLLTLVYILENDLGILRENMRITEGVVTSDMMRKEPYIRVEINELDRVVYICEEEGNASYIFDTKKIEEFGILLDKIDIYSKDEKNLLISKHQGIGVRIIQTKYWREAIYEALSDIITEKLSTSSVKSSEFIDAEKYPSFGDFKKEVAALYPGEGPRNKWYQKERKNHPHWHSAPHQCYAQSGWNGWQDLLEQKERWLGFEELKAEARIFYKGETNVADWYEEERKKHPHWPSSVYCIYKDKGWIDYGDLVGREGFVEFAQFKNKIRNLYKGEVPITSWYKQIKQEYRRWPAHPDQTYAKDGWIGWEELVGAESRNKEWMSFNEFKTDVLSSYRDEKNVAKWYANECEKHPDWPANPDQVYKGEGWGGFPHLVERPSRLKEWQEFEEFKREVMTAFNGQSNVQEWYLVEISNHPKWPTNPHTIYKDEWTSWPGLVDKENPRSKDFLGFEDFQKEVIALYPGTHSIKKWYNAEYKKHPNWPSNPHRTYKNKGWKGFANLMLKQ